MGWDPPRQAYHHTSGSKVPAYLSLCINQIWFICSPRVNLALDRIEIVMNQLAQGALNVR